MLNSNIVLVLESIEIKGGIGTKWAYQSRDLLFKISSRNNRTMCEICSKLTRKTPERCHWRRSGVFIVNFKQISHFVCYFICWLWTSKCRLGLLIFTKLTEVTDTFLKIITLKIFPIFTVNLFCNRGLFLRILRNFEKQLFYRNLRLCALLLDLNMFCLFCLLISIQE